jgi:hypothetical protein
LATIKLRTDGNDPRKAFRVEKKGIPDGIREAGTAREKSKKPDRREPAMLLGRQTYRESS